MGALALLWPPLLWLLFAVLFGQPPGTLAQTQGMCRARAGRAGGRAMVGGTNFSFAML